MKIFVCTTLLLGSAVSGFSQSDTLTYGKIRLSALSQSAAGKLRALQGKVRIETANVIIQADNATFDSDTSQIDAIGNVHITLKK